MTVQQPNRQRGPAQLSTDQHGMSKLRISSAAARRIARLASSGGCTPQRVLDSALRTGLDYVEWFQRDVAKGQAAMRSARKAVSPEQVLKKLTRIKAALARALKKAA
jgi:predicted transcriptional regulator